MITFLPDPEIQRAEAERKRLEPRNRFQFLWDSFFRTRKFKLTAAEALLEQGLADDLHKPPHRLVFGPTRSGARLESDKAWCKQVLRSANVPTAEARTFGRDQLDAALHYVRSRPDPLVVKASGLCAGKGVVVCDDREQALAALERIMRSREFGDAGATVVVEERLVGQEMSVLALVDGGTITVLDPCQDHKQVGEGDTGPNTGGMGAYSPAPVVTSEIHQRAMDEVILPALRGMVEEGTPFSGFLYAGLMIGDDSRIGVLEFNCRMGDPETQPILMRYSGDFAALMLHAAHGSLDEAFPEWDPRPALGVVLAAAGYPESPRKGDVIDSLPADSAYVHVFHAGTALGEDGLLRTSGGRVLTVTALGDDLLDAARRAYAGAEQITFDGRQMRRDIGHRALSKE